MRMRFPIISKHFGGEVFENRIEMPDVGAWLSLVERTVRDREVGGSNPLAPTNQLQFTQTITADSRCQPFFVVWPICGQNF